MLIFQVKKFDEATEAFNAELNAWFHANVKYADKFYPNPFFASGAMCDFLQACDDAGAVAELEIYGAETHGGYPAAFEPSAEWQAKYLTAETEKEGGAA